MRGMGQPPTRSWVWKGGVHVGADGGACRGQGLTCRSCCGYDGGLQWVGWEWPVHGGCAIAGGRSVAVGRLRRKRNMGLVAGSIYTVLRPTRKQALHAMQDCVQFDPTAMFGTATVVLFCAHGRSTKFIKGENGAPVVLCCLCPPAGLLAKAILRRSAVKRGSKDTGSPPRSFPRGAGSLVHSPALTNIYG